MAPRGSSAPLPVGVGWLRSWLGLKKHRSPAEGEFLFEIGDTPLEEMLTSFGELPRFLRTARSLGLAVSVQRNLELKHRRRGLESFLALNAVGGECLEDFDVLREEAGMAAMLGYEPPAGARKFLCPFHGQEKIEQAQQQQLDVRRASIIRGESEALAGLAAVGARLTASGSCVFSSSACGPAEPRLCSASHTGRPDGRRGQFLSCCETSSSGCPTHAPRRRPSGSPGRRPARAAVSTKSSSESMPCPVRSGLR